MTTANPNITVATLPKGERAELRVTIAEYRGRRTIDLRIFEEFAASTGARSPTKAGVALSIERLPELRAALEEAERQAIDLGLIGEEVGL